MLRCYCHVLCCILMLFVTFGYRVLFFSLDWKRCQAFREHGAIALESRAVDFLVLYFLRTAPCISDIEQAKKRGILNAEHDHQSQSPPCHANMKYILQAKNAMRSRLNTKANAIKTQTDQQSPLHEILTLTKDQHPTPHPYLPPAPSPQSDTTPSPSP